MNRYFITLIALTGLSIRAELPECINTAKATMRGYFDQAKAAFDKTSPFQRYTVLSGVTAAATVKSLSDALRGRPASLMGFMPAFAVSAFTGATAHELNKTAPEHVKIENKQFANKATKITALASASMLLPQGKSFFARTLSRTTGFGLGLVASNVATDGAVKTVITQQVEKAQNAYKNFVEKK